jgi:hypothetical protein
MLTWILSSYLTNTVFTRCALSRLRPTLVALLKREDKGTHISTDSGRPALFLFDVQPVPMFTCPHCGFRTSIFGAIKFASIEFGRAKCDHCEQEFMIVNNVAMTKEEYRKGGKVQ